MLTTTKEMLLAAQKGGYGIGAFNVENAEMMLAVIRAAEECHAPVILQTTPSTLKYLPPKLFAAMAKALAEEATVPVAIHLDHGSSRELAEKCMRCGYTSVMIDGSQKSFEENIALTAATVEDAKKYGIPVEAELGTVGGKEDSTVSSGCQYTDPEDAAEFVARTGADSLAIGIGTAHGIYAQTPVLDLERIVEVKGRVDIPLILHGASGLSDEVVAQAVARGICKVNFATELRVAFIQGAAEYLGKNPTVIDPKKLLTPGILRVSQLVSHKIQVCGGAGKA